MIVKETIRINPSGESASCLPILAGAGVSFHWESKVRRSTFNVPAFDVQRIRRRRILSIVPQTETVRMVC